MTNPASEAESFCEKMTFRFFMALDAREHKFCADSFAADGTWDRKGKELKGPQNVLQELDARAASRVTLHLINNLVATATSQDTVTVDYYLVAHDAQDAGDGKTPLARFAGARVCSDILKRQEGDVWKIQSKTSRPMMTGS